VEDLWPTRLENCRVACPVGELDVATAQNFADLLRGTVREPGGDWLIVDLSRVTFMGCAPLYDLCRAWERSRETGRWTRVVYHQESIGRLLSGTSLQERFPRYASLDDAWREHPDEA
jgi:anti-anti-sigma factor